MRNVYRDNMQYEKFITCGSISMPRSKEAHIMAMEGVDSKFSRLALDNKLSSLTGRAGMYTHMHPWSYSGRLGAAIV